MTSKIPTKATGSFQTRHKEQFRELLRSTDQIDREVFTQMWLAIHGRVRPEEEVVLDIATKAARGFNIRQARYDLLAFTGHIYELIHALAWAERIDVSRR